MLLFAGDQGGFIITAYLIEPNKAWISAFGAFRDDKNGLFRVINVFIADGD